MLNADDFLASKDMISRTMEVFANTETDGVYGDLLYVSVERAWRQDWRSGGIGVRKDGCRRILRFTSERKSLREGRQIQNGFWLRADYEFMVRRVDDLTLAYVLEILVCIEVGGMSNRSLNNRWKAHQMDCKAWRENGLSPRSLNLLLKPLRKLPQFWRKDRLPRLADSAI